MKTPLEQRLTLLDHLHNATNECEKVAAECALRVLEHHHPFVAGMKSGELSGRDSQSKL